MLHRRRFRDPRHCGIASRPKQERSLRGGLTFDMRGGRKWARPACGRPLDGIRRDFPPSRNGAEAPRLSCDHQPELKRGSPMSEITRVLKLIARVGVDLAKR